MALDASCRSRTLDLLFLAKASTNARPPNLPMPFLFSLRVSKLPFASRPAASAEHPTLVMSVSDKSRLCNLHDGSSNVALQNTAPLSPDPVPASATSRSAGLSLAAMASAALKSGPASEPEASTVSIPTWLYKACPRSTASSRSKPLARFSDKRRTSGWRHRNSYSTTDTSCHPK
jgi:hypothetical protein